jgi:ribonuclease VapC
LIVDSSALIAILQNERDADSLARAIESAAKRVMSVANYLECYIVLESRQHAKAVRELDLLIERAQIELKPVDVEQGRLARHAFGRFGKGRHRAALNYGDCFAYALAAQLGEPLLCKGDDFAKTDLRLVESARHAH